MPAGKFAGLLGVSEPYARRTDGEHRSLNAALVHFGERLFGGPGRQIAGADGGYGAAVIRREQMMMNVDAVRPGAKSLRVEERAREGADP